MMAEEIDMTDQYNTKLSDEDEAKYQQWAKDNKREKDTYDYDMRGAWKEGITADPSGHFPDTYKKPNHPTFSHESQYATPENPGGHWEQDETGTETLKPYDPRLKFAQGGPVLPRSGPDYRKLRNKP
jgi:hypothetical protein